MIMSLKMESLLNPKSKHGIMDDQSLKDFDHHVSESCSSSSSIINEQEEEDKDEVNSFNSLEDMSSLLLQLPLKRGLSKHYNGKSQSFTSLSNVRSLEDLAKQENPHNKKLKSCHGGLLIPPNHTCSRLIRKKKQSHSGFFRNNNNNNNNRPPIPPPYRSTTASSFANQTRLFA